MWIFYSSEECLIVVLSQYKILLVDTLDFVCFVGFFGLVLFCLMARSHLFK